SGALDARQPDPRRTVQDLVLRGDAALDVPARSEGVVTVPLDPDVFHARRARLPEHALEVGALTEETDRFLIQVVLSEKADRVQVATYRVPKVSWGDWWRGIGPALDPMSVEAVTGTGATLPIAVGNGSSFAVQSCGTDDTWATILASLPEPREQHTAV